MGKGLFDILDLKKTVILSDKDRENLVSVLVVTVSAYLLNLFSLPALGVFIIAMAITHTFLDVLPAIFLGAPDSDTALGVLPGHKLLLEGKGLIAVKLTVAGGLFAGLEAQLKNAIISKGGVVPGEEGNAQASSGSSTPGNATLA